MNVLLAITVVVGGTTIVLLTAAMLWQLPGADGSRRRVLVDRLLGNLRGLTLLALLALLSIRLRGGPATVTERPESCDFSALETRLARTHDTILEAVTRIEALAAKRCNPSPTTSVSAHVLDSINGFPVGHACDESVHTPACDAVDGKIVAIGGKLRALRDGTHVAGVQIVGSFDRRPFQGPYAQDGNVRLAGRRATYVRNKLAGDAGDVPVWTAIRGPSLHAVQNASGTAQQSDGFEADRSVEVVLLLHPRDGSLK